jgi:hypothetical protein
MSLSVRRWVVGVPVYLPKLPERQQRWSGDADIGHQVTLAGKKRLLAHREVLDVAVVVRAGHGHLMASGPLVDRFVRASEVEIEEAPIAGVPLADSMPRSAAAPSRSRTGCGRSTCRTRRTSWCRRDRADPDLGRAPPSPLAGLLGVHPGRGGRDHGPPFGQDAFGNTNLLRRVITGTAFSFTPSAASTAPVGISGVGSVFGSKYPVGPGTLWLVIRNTSATQTFDIGITGGGSLSRAHVLTKAITALGSTLDISGWSGNGVQCHVRPRGEQGASIKF